MVLYRWTHHCTHRDQSFAVLAREAGSLLRSLWNSSFGIQYKTYNKRATLAEKIVYLWKDNDITLGKWWELNLSAPPDHNMQILITTWVAALQGKCTLHSLENTLTLKVCFCLVIIF